jgi:hypothetical protein
MKTESREDIENIEAWAEAITTRQADWIHLQIMMACQAF